MKYRTQFLTRRGVAAVLALALSLLLPAWAEELIELPAGEEEALELILPESDADEALVGEAGDLNPTDAVPEAAQVNTDVQANTSVPEPDYETEYYSFDVGKKSSLTVMIGDTLEIFFPKGNGKSWKSSKTSVARFDSEASDEDSACLIALKKGTTKLTLTLSTGKKYKVTLKVKDPYALKSMSLTKKSVTLLAGKDLDLSDYITMKPAYARPTFTYKSSRKTVAKVNSGGIVTGMKAGTATITVSSSGIKKKLKVTVKSNATAKLHSAPTTSAAKALGKKWTLWPRTLALRGDGSLICKLYLLNGSAGKLKSLNNLDLAVSLDTDNGDNLIAQGLFKKVSVSCAKNRYATVKLTFTAKHVSYSGVKLSSLDASKLRFRLYSQPTAKNGSHTYAYSPTVIESTGDPTVENPIRYRALLVSNDDFYRSHTAGQSSAWEHITRNRTDVSLMNTLLGRVKTPSGTRYSVTVKHNLSRAGLVKAIQSAFSGADENDVSLFFIATHGDSSDVTPANKSGGLYMASLDETYPELFYLSELCTQLLKVPGKVIVILESCGSGASIYKNDGAAAYKSAQAFDTQAVELFREADPGVIEGAPVGSGGLATNTGELRKVNKFYVLCCSEYREESWGNEPGGNFFTQWLAKGAGKSGSMPADTQYAGNKNGVVDLHELYRYISGVGDHTLIEASDGNYYQHVQVYPSDVRYALFK